MRLCFRPTALSWTPSTKPTSAAFPKSPAASNDEPSRPRLRAVPLSLLMWTHHLLPPDPLTPCCHLQMHNKCNSFIGSTLSTRKRPCAPRMVSSFHLRTTNDQHQCGVAKHSVPYRLMENFYKVLEFLGNLHQRFF